MDLSVVIDFKLCRRTRLKAKNTQNPSDSSSIDYIVI
jgi:hypothetical protein